MNNPPKYDSEEWIAAQIHLGQVKSIHFDTRRQKFRVVVGHNHVCYTKTAVEAVRRRNAYYVQKGII